MQFIRGLINIRPQHRPCAATIGNFDGIHLGHQQILARLVTQARQMNLPATVITFEPYPLEFFRKEHAQPRLMLLREKLPLLADAGIDQVLCIHFNNRFAQIGAHDFISEVLQNQLDVRYLIVGDDFRFGHKRQGNTQLLQAYSDHGAFKFEVMTPYTINDDRISSTLVRQYLQQGHLQQAERCLGRTFFMKGRIAHGDKLGRRLGFPTANIHTHRYKIPLTGVYAVRVYGIADAPYQGVANIGYRPAVGGQRPVLETYIFGFDANIYGRHVTVEFIYKLREEVNYTSLDELKQQIQQDAINAKAYFQQYES